MKIRGDFMALPGKLHEPVFLKEGNQAEIQLTKLRELKPLLNEEGQTIIKQDIRCLEYGIIGEKNIAFELKNSHMAMYILHDIYLEDGALSAQIDYLVVTRKICFVIECKNLYGDIEINNSGDFIRTIEFGKSKRKEGIYSPITQNQRHLDLLKRLRVNRHQSKIIRFMADKYFSDMNKSIVVLANPKTILNTEFAKKQDKEKVIRADQLVNYIKKTYNDSKEAEVSDRQLLRWAESYMKLHKEVAKDYTAKYDQYLVNTEDKQEKISNQVVSDKDISQTDIYQDLKQYRLIKSREEKIKPYVIYTNKQLEDLIVKMPRTIDELYGVVGFGKVKTNKYGEDIIRIIMKYTG